MIDESKMQQEINDFRTVLPMLLQHMTIKAQLIRAKYNALIKEGFTEKQALELCRTDNLV